MASFIKLTSAKKGGAPVMINMDLVFEIVPRNNEGCDLMFVNPAAQGDSFTPPGLSAYSVRETFDKFEAFDTQLITAEFLQGKIDKLKTHKAS